MSYNDDLHSLSHTKWNCKYHVAFAPKYRRKAFYDARRIEIREFDSCLHFFTNQIAQNVDYINAFEFFYCQIFEIICSNT